MHIKSKIYASSFSGTLFFFLFYILMWFLKRDGCFSCFYIMFYKEIKPSCFYLLTSFEIKMFTKSLLVIYKKSLKIPKGQSESVYRRRTDNTMAKRKSTKGQTTIYKTLLKNLKIKQCEPH